MFSRIAVVNRGESAMRLIHAVRDLNAEAPDSQSQIETVALHTSGERRAMFVREADHAYDLGPASARPYLDLEVLERAIVDTGADAVWVGWGFVAEDPAFAQLCERLGVTFIGPSAQAMRRLGDKIGSKLIAEEVGVPVAPWSGGGVDTLEDAQAAAARIGYPLMLKATAGGGGRGIRRVDDDEQLAEAYSRTREEAERAFGSGVVFLERLVTGARHVEVQVIADGQGTAWAVGVRDCSVQRRNQKVIEESSSPLLDADQEAELRASAERLALAVDYSGAGTVEFLYHPKEKFFAFLEVNTRLQVEHPITEEVTGTDLVQLQLHVAAGGRLGEDRPQEIGHAVEARLNAEDPDRDFAPAPGRIALLELPSGPGVRVDTGVAEGDSIPPEFDSMIAKVIAHGRDRAQALARLRRAMRETTVVIEGGATNKGFVLELLDDPAVISGEADTGWIDRARADGELVATQHTGVALLVAAVEAYEAQEAAERTRLLETARGGRPQVQHRVGNSVDLSVRGATAAVTVLRTGPHRFTVSLRAGEQEQVLDAAVERMDSYRRRVTVAGRPYRVVTAAHGPVQFVEVDGVAHRVSREEGGVVRAPAPALVVATPVRVGDVVEAGAPVLVLESMKMETVLPAPATSVVKELLVTTGSQVESGAPLARLEPAEDAPTHVEDERPLDLEIEDAVDPEAPDSGLDQLRAVLSATLLGYDIDQEANEATLAEYLERRVDTREVGEQLRAEIALVEIFADFAELSRNRPVGEDLNLDARVHTPREHFHTYLQSLDPERGGLPESFRRRLERVLAHYRVDGLERTPELEEAVFRIFLAQQRSVPEVALVSSLLQSWLSQGPPEGDVAVEARVVLDRLLRATQLRYPALGDLARSVRFRWFDEPVAEAERAEVLADVADDLARLAQSEPGPERDAEIDQLAGVPERLVSFLNDGLHGDRFAEYEPMLSVLVKRHYGEHGLRNVTEDYAAGRSWADADYTLDGRETRLVSTVGAVAELTGDSELATQLRQRVSARGSDQQAVVDLYLSWPQVPSSSEDASHQLAAHLADLGIADQVRRVAVAVSSEPGSQVDYYVFRPNSGGDFVEDELVRGVHPMVGRRLTLWRLREFDISRLDAPEDVLLYRCVARGNDADQRLVALAQVRQNAVVRDEEGEIVGLPHIERALANCVEGIRRARADSGSGQAAPDMNYVWVHIWPTIDADVEQLTALTGRIAPTTAGAGVVETLISGSISSPDGSEIPTVAAFTYQPGSGVVARLEEPPTDLLEPLDDYAQKVLRARRRGVVYPYELFPVIAGPGGSITEYDLDASGRLAPVHRPYGQNSAGIIVAVVSTPTERYPEGVTRVLLCGDPLRALGALSEAECTRVAAAIDLAASMGVPVEWYALSAGARISMESGTENMDWVAAALKRIVEFTQAGGEINIVVAGINVGAQPYWNAEATMLMHTKGILVMTPDSAMVLTGKQSLDFSGGVSAEDNHGIGGFDRVMGPNGQAQYWAPDLVGAQRVLMAHYDHTYAVPGEPGPRRALTTDPFDRDVTRFPHDPAESGFTRVGDIFGQDTNPDRKKAFDIRTVMASVSDADHVAVERWAGMADADTSVVHDAHIGGIPVTLIGIESKSVARRGFPPADGPATYTAGTLFPRSSKKTARAINAASGVHPVVVLANLSGFDGSPDSMRNLQLEYGAEIGRAIVNFEGPIVFCVISRYHGGAFVVFSKALNPRMTVLAVEGARASVLGGAPAAAVVFTREVDARTARDERVTSLQEEVAAAAESDRAAMKARLATVRAEVRAEMLGQVAQEFDSTHDIHRAVRVGSVDEVIPAARLRPAIIHALEQGLSAG